MPRSDTDPINMPPERRAIRCIEAVRLVLQHPGCTVGELALRLIGDQDDTRAMETARTALLPALQQAASRGFLINGAARICRQRCATITTWLPAPAMDLPMQVQPGLLALMQRIDNAAADLAAEEALT